VDPADFSARFATLEDCFCDAYGVERARIMAALDRACVGLQSWRERLRATAYAAVDVLAEDQRVTHFVVNEVRLAGERPRLMLEEAVHSLFDLLDEGRGERPDPEAISRNTAEALGGSFFAQIHTAAGRGEQIRAEIVPQMLYAALLPYLGPEPAAEELRIPAPALKREGRVARSG
jgi:hypothetical protein